MADEFYESVTPSLRGEDERRYRYRREKRYLRLGLNLPGQGPNDIDAAASIVLPGFFNLHYHADKCLLGEIMRPNASGTLPEAI